MAGPAALRHDPRVEGGASADPPPVLAVHQSRRAALAVRAVYALASVGLAAGSALAVLLTEGARRRELWDAAADLLLAHGLVGLFLLPLLLAVTARLRRGTRLAPTRVTVREGRLRLALPGGESLETAESEVTVVARTPAGPGRTCVALLLGRSMVRDGLRLEMADDAADDLLAALPRGPRGLDVGVRSLEAAGWAVTFAYAIGITAAFEITPLLRAVVPLGPGESASATDHAGWLLGVGLAAFWIAYGVFAWWTAARARVALGADGVRVTSLRGADVFVPFAELTRVERVRSGLRLHRRQGPPVELQLGAAEARAVEDAGAAIVAGAAGEPVAIDAPALATPAPRSAREVRHLASRLATESYRVEANDTDRLAERLIDPAAATGARVGAALALAHHGESGRRLVKQRAAALADEETRQVLEAIAEGEVDDVAIEQLLVRAR